MASFTPTISSLVSPSHAQRFRFPSSKYYHYSTLLRTRTLCSPQEQRSVQQHSTTTPPPEKKSFVVATGELFLGLASHLIKSRGPVGDSGSVAMFENPSSTLYEEKIGAVMEDIQPDVVWEQRVKDVEAECIHSGFAFLLRYGFAILASAFCFAISKIKVQKNEVGNKIRICDD